MAFPYLFQQMLSGLKYCILYIALYSIKGKKTNKKTADVQITKETQEGLR